MLIAVYNFCVIYRDNSKGYCYDDNYRVGFVYMNNIICYAHAYTRKI